MFSNLFYLLFSVQILAHNSLLSLEVENAHEEVSVLIEIGILIELSVVFKVNVPNDLCSLLSVRVGGHTTQARD